MNTPLRKIAVAAALAGLFASPGAFAQDKYLGEIVLVGWNFCARDMAPAEGQLLSIAQNSALFALYGTQYGGDGRTTFGLPDLRGRVPKGAGTGPALDPVREGEKGGREDVSLAIAHMPAHTHGATISGTASNGNTDNPTGAVPARLPRANIYSNGGGADATMATTVTVGSAGNGQPVDIRNPYLGLRYCVVVQGIFPSRN